MEDLTKATHHAITVATILTDIHTTAKATKENLKHIRHNIPTDIITANEKKVLEQAQDLLEKIQKKTGFYAIKEYLEENPK